MKYRIYHSQKDCPIRKRYGKPFEDDAGAHLSFAATKVGQVISLECRFCYFIRSRNEAEKASEGHCTGSGRKRGRNAA
jgi:hypothetical protein